MPGVKSDDLHPEARRNLLAALAVVTDLIHRESPPDFAETELGAIIRNNELDDVSLVFGLINLCTVLLLKLEKAGHPTPAVLADIGLRYR